MSRPGMTRIARCGSTGAWSGPGWASPPTRAGPGRWPGRRSGRPRRPRTTPADLINVALEELVRARLELPGYSTLDELAASIRAQVNAGVFVGIAARMTPADVQVIDGLLEVDPVRRR